jgi:hypothetical protein
MGTFAKRVIADYRLFFADQGDKLPLYVSVCSKQTKVCHFCFPLVPFSVYIHDIYENGAKHIHI